MVDILFIPKMNTSFELLWLALCFQATHCLFLKPDIRADTNRDGSVDVEGLTDVDNKAFWSTQHGAIFLPNIGDKELRCHTKDSRGTPLSNDELAACNDASGHLLLAPEYLAPLRTIPMNVSSDTTASIYATPRAAYDRVRIFLLDDTLQPNSTTSWRLID
jgi:protein-arginine deiminase